jgi:hypothetical protein
MPSLNFLLRFPKQKKILDTAIVRNYSTSHMKFHQYSFSASLVKDPSSQDEEDAKER